MRLAMTLVILLLAASPARAQDPPACTSAREGAVACLAGRLCACRFTRGGSMTGRPDRHAWDCGILRPACGAGLVPPAMPPTTHQAPVPEVLLQPSLTPRFKPERGAR